MEGSGGGCPVPDVPDVPTNVWRNPAQHQHIYNETCKHQHPVQRRKSLNYDLNYVENKIDVQNYFLKPIHYKIHNKHISV